MNRSDLERMRNFMAMLYEGKYLGFHLKRRIFLKERHLLQDQADEFYDLIDSELKSDGGK